MSTAITAANRIKGVWAQVQSTEWNSNFLQDPNAYSIECDVLIVTNVLQAGHSLDCHFTTSYDILFNNVLSFPEELQFISRLRYLDRTDVCEFKHAWIEKSVSNRNIASISKITASLASLMNVTGSSSNTGLIGSIIASVNSERADTGNRHDFLWANEYKLSSISKMDMTYDSSIHSHTIYTSSWVQTKIKNFLKGKGAQTIRTMMQGLNTESTLDVAGLLDELQYVNVNELITTHLTSSTSSLQERVRCSENPTDSFNVVTNILKPSSFISTSSISNSLQPFYCFLYYLDYRLYLLNPNDATKSRYWLIRDGYKTDDHSHQVKVRMVQMVNRIVNALSAGQWTHAIQDDSFTTTLTSLEVFELIKQGGDEQTYALIFGKNNNFNSDFKNYTSTPVKRGFTTNGLLSKIFRKIGLKLDTKNHPTTFGVSFINIAEALCIVKALTSQEHYQTILSCISDTIQTETIQAWDDNNYYTTYE